MRPARLLLCVAVVAGAVPVLGVGTAHACLCAPATDAQFFDRAGAVFTGTVVRREVQPTPTPPPDAKPELAGRTVLYTFDVGRVYKGAITTPQLVTRTSDDTMCGPPLGGRGLYVVFTAPVLPESGVPTTSPCSGTRRLSADETLPFDAGWTPPAENAADFTVPSTALGPTSDDEESPFRATSVVGILAVVLIGAGLLLRRHGRRDG